MCGVEWVVEAHGCHPARLTSLEALRGLFDFLISEMNLHPVCEATWHQFPVTGGITGLHLLSESHLACHTFPEYGSLCLNVFCCRPRSACDVEKLLRESFGASAIQIRKLERPYSGPGYQTS
jgi:S-adenosylmethionine decarboxylase